MKVIVCLFSVLALAGTLSGCAKKTRFESVNPPTPSAPLRGAYANEEVFGSQKCTRFEICDMATVFPNLAFRDAPPQLKCTMAEVVYIGKVIAPSNPLSGVQANVWTAMVVPAEGGNPTAVRVVGSTDPRFDELSEKMAKTMVFRPLICDGKAYDAFVIAPMFYRAKPPVKSAP